MDVIRTFPNQTWQTKDVWIVYCILPSICYNNNITSEKKQVRFGNGLKIIEEESEWNTKKEYFAGIPR